MFLTFTRNKRLVSIFGFCALLFTGAGIAQNPFINATGELPDIQGIAPYSGIPVAVVDMNGDGRDDIIRIHRGHDLTITLQTGTGWTNLTTVALNFFPWAIAVADIDQDRTMDVYVGGNGNKAMILYGKDNYALLPSSELPISGLGAPFFSQGTNFVDIDGDGLLDLFACGDTTKNLTWRGLPGGSLVAADLLPESNPTSGPNPFGGNYGSLWTDVNNDGLVDLHLSKCKQGAGEFDVRRLDMFLEQSPAGSYTNRAAALDLDNRSQTWSVDFGDLDNDGVLEAVVITHTDPQNSNGIASLYVQEQGAFKRISSTISKLGYLSNGAQVLMRDFDNDGLLDVLLGGQDGVLYRNVGLGPEGYPKFHWWTNFDGVNQSKMASFAVGDLNHDGFQDVYATYPSFVTPSGISNNPQADQPDQYWKNDLAGNGNRYLGVLLEGKTGNYQAIGARVWVSHRRQNEVGGIKSSTRLETVSQLRDVRAGESYGIMNSFTQHFGLGTYPSQIDVAVRWPAENGVNQTMSLQGVSANQVIGIQQGVLPDLTVETGSVSTNPSSIQPGQSGSVTFALKNLTGTHAVSSRVEVLFSEDDQYQTTDPVLANVSMGDVGARSQEGRQVNISIPQVALGEDFYYLLFRVDAGEDVTEHNENNNLTAVQVSTATSGSGIDLIVETASGSPATLLAGEQVYTRSRVKNTGTSYSGNSVMGIFYSHDQHWDAQQDSLLFSRTVGGLDPDGTSFDTEYVTVPSSAIPGTRYLLFVADMNNQRIESNESNNVYAVPISVFDPAFLPDLISQNPSTSHGNVKPNDHFWSYVRVRNQGVSNSMASSSRTEIWLSTDTALQSGSDTRLATVNAGALAGGSYEDLSRLTRMPASTLAGQYYLIFVADGPDFIDETNESNNQAVVGITVDPPTNFPDYVVTEASLGQSTIAAGASLGTSCRLRNIGTGTTTPSTFKYLLSTDADYSSNDVLLRSVAVGDIGFPPQFGYSVTIPSATGSGNYYILLFTDANNDIIENDETNNIVALPVTVQ